METPVGLETTTRASHLQERGVHSQFRVQRGRVQEVGSFSIGCVNKNNFHHLALVWEHLGRLEKVDTDGGDYSFLQRFFQCQRSTSPSCILGCSLVWLLFLPLPSPPTFHTGVILEDSELSADTFRQEKLVVGIHLDVDGGVDSGLFELDVELHPPI
jgi:hypothetical protein